MAKRSIDIKRLPTINGARVAVLQSSWYGSIVQALHTKCEELLKEKGARVETHVLPGTFEFPFAAQVISDADAEVEAIICLSVVVKGETYHFDTIINSAIQGLRDVSVFQQIPVINGILPVSDINQALERSRDDEYNKGIEAAVAAIEMISWNRAYIPRSANTPVDFH